MNQATLEKLRTAMTHNRFNARLGVNRLHQIETAGTDIDSYIVLLREACVIMSELRWP